MKLAGLSRTDGGFVATYERLLPHPPEDVWAAVATAAGIAAWFVPVELDPQPGGAYVIHHTHAGVDGHEEVLAYEPGRIFEHTFGRDPRAEPPFDSARWEVHPDAEGTRLVLTYRFRRLAGAEGVLAGWHTWLAILRAVLDGDERRGHEPPHGRIVDGQYEVATPGRGHWVRHDERVAAYRDLAASLEP